MKQPYTIGRHIWYKEHWTGQIDEACITGTQTDVCGNIVYQLHDYVTEDTLWVSEQEVYPTKETCLAAHQRAFNTRVAAYESRIQTIEDLVRFGATHRVSPCGPHTDYAAMMAYKHKATELFGPIWEPEPLPTDERGKHRP